MTLRPVRRPRRMACAAALALAMLAPALPARSQADAPEASLNEPPAPSIPCTEINNRAMEATLVVRQHASQLSFGFESDARAQAAVVLAWLDQWAGRLRGFLEVGEFSGCLDEGDAETYRRALASATRVANQAREDLLRPVRAPQQQPQQQQRPRRP
ncbi:hypothetical protein GXW74_07570 [Roseomonas eburnea]|uniref:UrcA family protein n=1 Tax=Neoroseomonas eburnea TaxID=1346889 RepID=A0A9X9X9F5_9PROT|nr:hypothetical protein [Neoroseomonas eburnea]MBR0680341.1 hypothetical protein [Neoroseomonas eburnea]